MSKRLKPKAEHMGKAELVQEFRQLQKWYNALKVAATKLETEHAALQIENDQLKVRNIQLVQQIDLGADMLQKEITSANASKQDFLHAVQKHQIIMHKQK